MSDDNDCLNLTKLYNKLTNEFIKNIDVNEYINLKNKELFTIKCCDNHDLTFCNGTIKKPYFRHSCHEDYYKCSKTQWHLDWQQQFDSNTTEICFNKLNNQIKDRRADIYLKEHNVIVELQHSQITINEIRERKHDYNIHNLEILWIIDGNKNINVKKNNTRIYLEFISTTWKYESFIDYKYIFIDIDNYIYVIFPNLIKNNMIDVKQPYAKNDFINLLKININEIIKEIPYQCNLYIKQQGAGNGKTYGIIQSLDNNKDFHIYNTFIIVSKQHSAKTIIYNEFNEQYYSGKLNNIELIGEPINNNKIYIIKYTNKITDKKCQIIISTIDSLYYRLGNINNTNKNKFEGIVLSIIDDYINEAKINNIIYSNNNLKLNKECCLIIDETQDLSEDYGKALINIMKNRYIDGYIVGDKLQSISNENNAFIYLLQNDLSDKYINKVKYDDINVCRRFHNKSLVKLVNAVIPFDKYNLLPITPHKNDQIIDENYKFIIGKNVYDKDTNINEEIKNIMRYYKKEVIEYDRKPNDFLFISPFTAKNFFMEAIERSIQTFWTKQNDDTTYNQYVLFHKSQDGTCIDLNESNDKTRLVSIHTSKGDGRKVVFVIGLYEKGLLLFSKGEKNLIYDSLIHVALTRQKEKIYIRIEENNDDIHIKFKDFVSSSDIKPDISQIKKDIKYYDLIKNINNDDFSKLFNDTFPLNIIDKEKQTIDIQYHIIRYACLITAFYIKILKYDELKQLIAKFNNIKNASINSDSIIDINSYKKYNDLLQSNNNLKKDKIDKKPNNKKLTIPILNLSNKFKKYFNIIIQNVINIQEKINEKKLENLCPYERIILLYMYDVINTSFDLEITITELYKITDIYNNTFNCNIEGHKKCLCNSSNDKIKFKDNKNPENIRVNNYLHGFYEELANINDIYDTFFNKYKNLKVLTDFSLTLNNINNTSDLTIYNKFKFIAYNDEFVFNIKIKPQLNELNYYELINEAIFDTYIIKNCDNGKEDKNIKRFKDKKIKTIIIALNLKEFYEIDDNELNKNTNDDSIKTLIKKQLFNKLKLDTVILYDYYNYYKNNLDDMQNDILDKNNEKIPKFIRIYLMKNSYNNNISKTDFNINLYSDIEKEINKLFKD